MPDHIEVFAVTAPANTAKPGVIIPISLSRPGNVVRITVLIPDGHNAVAGLSLMQATSQIIPLVGGTYLVGNAEVFSFQITNPLDTQSWQAQVFNSGKYPHTFYLRIEYNEVVIPTSSFLPPVSFSYIAPSQLGG